MILVFCFLILTIKTSKQSVAEPLNTLEVISLASEPSQLFIPIAEKLPEFSSPKIIAGDAAEKLVENFFIKYNSPMTGTGKDIVSAARKYQIPFGLLPAIGQCEGNLGKVIPKDSYNTWGFGIYGDTTTKFSSWQEAIETISKAMRRDYFDFGLTIPEKIMTKYTPSSNGSWAFCVNKFLNQLTNP